MELAFSYLSDEEKKAYRKIEQGLRMGQTIISVGMVGPDVDLLRLLNVVVGDYPEFVYFDKSSVSTGGLGALQTELMLQGCMNQTLRAEAEAKLQQAVEDIAFVVDKHARDERELLENIASYLQEHVVYDEEAYRSVSRPRFAGSSILHSLGSMCGASSYLSDPYQNAHNAYGALVEKRAVCDGIADAFSLLCHFFEIPCMTVVGQSTFHGASAMNHCWNIVEYNHHYYHVDVTWDLNSRSAIGVNSYEYFGLTDDEILADHTWDYHKTPPCTGTELSYFAHHHMLAKTTDQLNRILVREMKNRSDVIRVKVDPSVVGKGSLEEMLVKAVRQAMREAKVSFAFEIAFSETQDAFILVKS